MKKHNRGFGSSLSLALLTVLFLIVAPTQAQEAAAEETAAAQAVGVSATTSEVTIKVNGSARAVETKLAENITFSGNVVINATVVTDPALPTSVTLFVDGKGVKGTSNETGIVYINSCEANLTRLFRPTDKITLTFAFFEAKTGAFLKSKTAVLTVNLTYDEKTKKLTGATGVVGTLDASITGAV